jgi:uncharacterized protein (TIGR03000 family)
MMRFHPRSAAVVLGSALAVAAASPLAAVAQKGGHSGSSGKSSQGHHSSGSGSGKSHATTSTGHPKTGAGTKAHSGHHPTDHHAKHKLDYLRQEIHRLERELRQEHLKHLHAAHARELERLRHEVHRLERELHTDPLKNHPNPPPQPTTSTKAPAQGTPSAPQTSGTTATNQESHSHHRKYGRVEVSLPHANAVVLINGSKTTSAGTHRVFKTPNLAQGQSYTYRVVAMWHHDGKEIREERTVHLTAGGTAHVHFHRPHHAQGQTVPSGQSAPAKTGKTDD